MKYLCELGLYTEKYLDILLEEKKPTYVPGLYEFIAMLPREVHVTIEFVGSYEATFKYKNKLHIIFFKPSELSSGGSVVVKSIEHLANEAFKDI